TPAGLPRRHAAMPPLRARAADVPRVLRQRGLRAAIGSVSAWRAARGHHAGAGGDGAPWSLPAMPVVAVVLQSPADPRVRLDAGDAPDAHALVAAASAAAAALDPALPLVVVAPDAARTTPIRGRHAVVPAGAAMDAAATAVATITVNHPLAAIAL